MIESAFGVIDTIVCGLQIDDHEYCTGECGTLLISLQNNGIRRALITGSGFCAKCYNLPSKLDRDYERFVAQRKVDR